MNENIKWKYNIGDRIIGESKKGNAKFDYTITNREIRHRKIKDNTCKSGYSNCKERFYEYRCNICSAEHLWKVEDGIGKYGCSCCAGDARIRGINTVGDLYPEYVSLFNGDDAFNPELSPRDLYDLKCPVCGHIKKQKIWYLKDGFYCDYCNSIGNKRPDLIKYFVNKEEVYTLSYCSGKQVLLQCPDCGAQRCMAVYTLYSNGFSCKICNDHFSYPEKIIINMLSQLNINFTTQLSKKDFNWCGRYKYDFYLFDEITIIEAHGSQHYCSNGFETYGGRTLEEEKKNDKLKEELAKNNNIKNYIIIDCRESNLEWIKNSILNSKLNELYDLSIVDWVMCESYARKNIAKEICLYWNEHKDMNLKDIAKKFRIGYETVQRYLKNGANFGWCDYNSRESFMNQIKKNALLNSSNNRKYITHYNVNTNKRTIYYATFAQIVELLNFKSDSCYIGVMIRKNRTSKSGDKFYLSTKEEIDYFEDNKDNVICKKVRDVDCYYLAAH